MTCQPFLLSVGHLRLFTSLASTHAMETKKSKWMKIEMYERTLQLLWLDDGVHVWRQHGNVI